ncbi:nuclease domain-containing protein [Ottowia sp. VDI28]|uniref:nuclease domain-containing protein n=1 Tax=Ottowia sp. VDI28 TaxID=3133968 RepID=UPI003C2F9DAB
MMRRQPLRSRPKAPARPDREQRLTERAARAVEYAKSCEISKSGNFTLARPVPKPEAHRNPHLLAMAKGMPCLLQVPSVFCAGCETVVACHSNFSVHGKAGTRKADDQYSVWGCAACHNWLDRLGAPRKQKEAVFMAAHLRQVLHWREIASNPAAQARDRKAAQWALDRLNATPVTDID